MTATVDRAEPDLVPDLSDPTAGRVAQAREMASAQVQLIADPAPLGLAAFALTTFLLSLANSGLMPASAEPVVFGVALAYGGVAQLLAGMWEFKKGNVFGATVFSSYGGFWLSFWAYVTFYAPGVPAEQHGAAAGWFLICWGIFTVLMFVGALRTTLVLAALFAVVVVAFFLLGLGALEGVTALTRAGGWVGLVAGAMAWYLCLAGVLSSLFGRPVLPNRSLVRA
ncbi:acetate uptake transporter [Nakamurella sp.]|uniref:acetate uptake transporter n=1 Tax=Nakamurella sp. TaxID=1869182 RepID=UPI003B3A1363